MFQETFTIIYHDKAGNFVSVSDKEFTEMARAEEHQKNEQKAAAKQKLRYNGVIVRKRFIDKVKKMKRFDDCFINLIME